MVQILILFIFLINTAYAQFNVKSFSEIKYTNVTKQSFEESCGVSALSSLFNLYGMDTNESMLLKDVNTTNMVNFSDLQRISIKYDFQAKGYKIPKSVFNQLTIPVIARIVRKENYPHFVVILNLEGDFVLILDPNNGKYLMHKNEFFQEWIEKDSNYILVVIPKIRKILQPIDFINISKIKFLKDTY